jgi:hypothetical protein
MEVIDFQLIEFSCLTESYVHCLGGGAGDSGGAGGGSSYSISSNTVYTTGYQSGDGSITIEFYTNPTFKFSCTKSIQNLTVPLGYNYMYVDMSGAASGGGGITNGIPGYGARVQSYLNVVPGDILHVSVGCRSSNCPFGVLQAAVQGSGGYNGGGASYGETGHSGATGGGGASDIRFGGISLCNRAVVAGGGGGYYCGSYCGIPKGGDAGKYGQSGSVPVICAGTGHNPAGGGNWTSGGQAAGTIGVPNPTSGVLGHGGNGGNLNAGGGGGGYFGGKLR